MFNFDEENCTANYTEKMITEIVSKHDKATLEAIERYCEENNIIPNIIEKEKLDLVLKLGIAEYNKKFSMDKEIFVKKIQVSEILFKYNVPINEAKIIGTFIEKLEQQCKKQKEINQKAIEYIKERFYFNEETGEYALLHTFDKCNVKELLDILKEASE